MSTTYQPKAGEFRHGLFDCCDSCKDCLCAYYCAPCYACQASQQVGQSTFCQLVQCCCYPSFLCCLRAEARNKKGIDGSCMGDYFASCCCPCCTVIQIKREFD